MELVSVIVPVYNTEKYLSECVESILANTYPALEVILVDDGSTDTSPAICDAYARKDSRVRVIHQENCGLVEARNAGLAIAGGTYVAFVDSDDTVSSVIYEQMVSAMENHDADIVTCEYCTDKARLDQNCTELHHAYESLDDQISVIMTAPWMREISWTSVVIWDKLYRRSRITEWFRKEYRISEDLRFNWDYIQNSRRMIVVPAALYYYRQHGESVMSAYRKSLGNEDAAILNARLIQRIASAFSPDGSRLNDYLDARAAYSSHGAIWRIFAAKKQSQYCDYSAEARHLIRTNYAKVWKDKSTYNLQTRLLIGLCCHCSWLWQFAASAYGWYLRRKKG